jgi:hypothetical protein
MFGDVARSVNDFLDYSRKMSVKKEGCPPGQCSICMYGSDPDTPCWTCDWGEAKREWFFKHKDKED